MGTYYFLITKLYRFDNFSAGPLLIKDQSSGDDKATFLIFLIDLQSVFVLIFWISKPVYEVKILWFYILLFPDSSRSLQLLAMCTYVAFVVGKSSPTQANGICQGILGLKEITENKSRHLKL